MPDTLPTLWDMPAHTGAKHSIFGRHLGAWFPKLGSRPRKLRIVDGFAGPGEYLGGEPGSPVVALKVLASHQRDLSACDIEFLFVEEDPKRFAHLEQVISSIPTATNVTVKPLRGSFKEVIASLLTREQGLPSPPTFFMIDPFGYEGMPMSLLQRLFAKPSTDFLISFMHDSINRFLGDPSKERALTELFGNDGWKKGNQIPSSTERWRFLLDTYTTELKRRGLQHVRPFAMRGDANELVYFLVFGTNHKEGMRVIKEAMWEIDPSGSYTFSDATNPLQQTLFASAPDFGQLKALIVGRFRGVSEVSMEDLEDFVLLETAFRETHYKRQILPAMEKSGELIVIRSPRKKAYSYPDGTVIRFNGLF